MWQDMAHINIRSMVTLFGSVRRSLGKRELGVILGWSALVAAILLYNFHSFYQHNSFTVGAARGPAFSDLDMLALLIMGFVAGLLLPEVKKLTYGYLASMAAVFTVGVITIFAYIWYIFQLGLVFQDVPFGWEIALLTAIVQVVGFMLPIGAVFSLMGILAGNMVSFFTK
jgi:hypothetical protein